jgi:hypothetical protein
MYQVNWDGFEAMVWTYPFWLKIVGFALLNFQHLPHHQNQPHARHSAHESHF